MVVLSVRARRACLSHGGSPSASGIVGRPWHRLIDRSAGRRCAAVAAKGLCSSRLYLSAVTPRAVTADRGSRAALPLQLATAAVTRDGRLPSLRRWWDRGAAPPQAPHWYGRKSHTHCVPCVPPPAEESSIASSATGIREWRRGGGPVGGWEVQSGPGFM